MPNLANAIKEEIRRLAKKEVKGQVSALKSASSQYRSDIAALKRENKDLKRKLGQLEKALNNGAAQSQSEATGDDDSPEVRFSSKWVENHRAKLELSRADYGKLVGVSSVTIYHWEKGNSRPRAKQLAAWGAIKKLRKREAREKLDAMG